MSSNSALIVDSNHDSAEMLHILLSLHGYQATVTHDGREAISAASVLKPRFIILELILPEMDGIVVARCLRKDLAESTIVAYTATYDDLPDRARSVGIDWFLLKPANPILLLACLAPDKYPNEIIRHAVDCVENIPSACGLKLQALSRRSADMLRSVGREAYRVVKSC